MNQNNLYIQYLEDALNHAKTGEPMKKWQVKPKNRHSWSDIYAHDLFTESMKERFELRIKPEPFKWTTYASRYYIGDTKFVHVNTVKEHHVSLENLQRKFPKLRIIAVRHHEVNVDD